MSRGVTILVAHFVRLCVALRILGMLGTLTTARTIDAFVPFSDDGGGFATGSAVELSACDHIAGVDILHPLVFTGLLFGALMPHALTAPMMKNVGMRPMRW